MEEQDKEQDKEQDTEKKDHQIYVMFFTYLFQEFEDLDPYNERIPTIYRIYKKLNSKYINLSMRLNNMKYGPFLHTKLAFKTYKNCNYKFTTYSVTIKEGLHKEEVRDLSDTRSYSIMCLNVTKQEYNLIKNLCEYLCNKENKFSNAKMYSYLFSPCKPFSLPNNKTNEWMCSEFVAYVLISCGLLKTLIHPSYINSTDLFKLIYHDCIDRIENSQIRYFTTLYSDSDDLHTRINNENNELMCKMTNSIYCYKYITNCNEVPKIDDDALAIHMLYN